MRNYLGFFIAAFSLIGCGEQFEGRFQGTGVASQETCTGSNVGDSFDMVVQLRKSAGGIRVLISEMNPISGIDDGNTSASRLLGQEFRASTIGNNRFITDSDDETYELTESSYNSTLRDIQNIENFSEEDLDQLSYFTAVIEGDLSSDRSSLESLTITYDDEKIRTNGITPCRIRISVPRDGFTLIQ